MTRLTTHTLLTWLGGCRPLLLLEGSHDAVSSRVRPRELKQIRPRMHQNKNKNKKNTYSPSSGLNQIASLRLIQYLIIDTYRSLVVLRAVQPHLGKGRLHHLQSLLVGRLQLLRLFVKLEEHQSLQQAVHFLCREENDILSLSTSCK